MKRSVIIIGKLVFIVLVCLGVLASCSDDDDNTSSTTAAIVANDPSYGFIANSTNYRMVIDIGEKKAFQFTLEPGATIDLNLHQKKTHVAHVVLLNAADRVVADYVNSFYIDEIPLDSQFRDMICSWYAEFISESGFGNNFGT